MHHTKHRRWIFSFAVIVMALTIATPALADYIGPKRTVTETKTVCKIILNECQYVEAKGEWRYKSVNAWSCSLEGKPWQAYSSESRPCNDTLHTNGYQYWSREDVTSTEIVTYPPATINGSLQNCTLQNGWCTTPPQLALSGVEPVAGERIIALEGTLNGETFACMNASCSVPLKQGNNNFTYWALSSFLDSSEMGTLTAKVDSQLPSITATLSGTLGLNGWYLGTATLTSSAADATSGLLKFTCTRDGVALGVCDVIPIKKEGPHILTLRALDNAGNVRLLTRNVSVDLQEPTLNASLNGTLGSNLWYTSAELNASAADPEPGSGLSKFEYNVDGSGWTAFPASGSLKLADGGHTVDLRAMDNAGRTVSTTTPYWLDTAAPNVNLDSSGTLGMNNWYVTNPTLTASASDDTSGLDLFEYSLDLSTWETYEAPFSLGDGIHTVSLWAQDQAGLVTQVERTYQVDTRAPQIAGSLSGVPGANGWFISEVTVSASASDPVPGSELEAFTYALDGSAETPYTEPLTLADGQHALQVSARDKAGLSHSIEQTIKIDTVQPSLTIETSLPNWNKDTITLSGTASDDGSGLSNLEVSLNDGQSWQAMTGTDAWSYNWNTLESLNGIHEIRMRASDQAGLLSQQTISVGVDNHPPEISLPDSWLQWDTVILNVLDKHSGLSEARVEISDPQGRWPARVIQLDPGQFPLEFKWDRRFDDGTVAEAGLYDVEVFASDHLGNIIDKSASIRVLLDVIPPGPTSTKRPSTPTVPVSTATSILLPTATPMLNATHASSPTATKNIVVSVFGTIESPPHGTSTPVSIPTPRATPTQSNVVEWLQSILIPGNNQESSTAIGSPEEKDVPQPVSTNNVLWGTAAAAAIGAATAYAQEEKRKREEEKARLKALEEAQEERRQKMKERKTAKMEAQRAQEAAWEEARLHQEKLEDFKGLAARARLKNELTRWEMQEEEKWIASQAEIRKRSEEKKKSDEEKKKAQERQAELQAYYSAKKQEDTSVVTSPTEKTWWEKGIDWIDNHQTEIALGLGVVAGAAVIVLSGGLATPLVAAALVGGAAVAAGGTTALMTVALNAHYDRPWNENLLKNVVLAGGAAAVVAGAGFLLHGASTAVGGYCAVHPATCARVEPVFKALDTVEETWLKAKLAYQTWKKDPAAAETAFELHSEYADGGMPGNAVIRELGDQASHLSKNAIPLVNKYGKDVIPLLVKHGDEGLKLIQKFGLDGIELLHKHGNDATDLVHLDKDVLEYVLKQGDDAVAALSRWSAKDLREHGLELALRAKKDAEVLADIKKLTSSGSVDPKNLTAKQRALIEAIAANSTQYADNGQVVLGKWVDISNGFVQTAQNTGSVHYNPHPDMWTMLGKLGDAQQEEVAWLVNKQVVQNGIEKGLPFEYTLNGIPTNSLNKELAAVRAIFSGKTNAEVMKILKSDKMPIRMKELQELQKAGYEFTFDNVSKSYILVKK